MAITSSVSSLSPSLMASRSSFRLSGRVYLRVCVISFDRLFSDAEIVRAGLGSDIGYPSFLGQPDQFNRALSRDMRDMQPASCEFSKGNVPAIMISSACAGMPLSPSLKERSPSFITPPAVEAYVLCMGYDWHVD